MQKICTRLIIILLLIFGGCTSEQNNDKFKPFETNQPTETASEENQSTETTLLPFRVIRTEQLLFENKTKENVLRVLHDYPFFTGEFLQITSKDELNQAATHYLTMIKNEALDTIYQTTKIFFGDLRPELQQLSEAFTNYQKYFKLTKLPTLYTAITGMASDMYVGDTAMVVSLEFFLAEKSKYRPNFPVYIAKRYRREYIVPYLMTAYGARHIESDLTDNSMIAEMIYYGKTYYLLKQLLPAIPDTILFGYTAEQTADVEKNQKIIWKHFLDNSLLFEPRHEIVNRYIGERPAVTEIGAKCPGRIGRWLGYQIVKSYMENHPDVKLEQMLRQKDARKIFNQSKYKPK